MPRVLPKNWVQPPKYGTDAVVPAPLNIVSQITHPRDPWGKGRSDKKLLNRLNLKGHVLCDDFQIYHQAHSDPRPMDVLKVLAYVNSVDYEPLISLQVPLERWLHTLHRQYFAQIEYACLEAVEKSVKKDGPRRLVTIVDPDAWPVPSQSR
jgi:hypothetical protein